MLRFDDFRLDPATLRVFRHDVPLDAPPQAVEVLAYLVERGGRIVPRQELLDRFWPRAGTGGDAALNTCIRRIRTLLEDDADTPRYIQTRPRAGYRFVGTLAEGATGPVSPPPSHRRTRSALGLSLLGTCVLAAGLWAHATLFPPHHRIAIEPAQGLCEYVLFPKFNQGLRESLIAQVSGNLPVGYSVAADDKHADLRARVSVRQTPQRTVVVLTLVDTRAQRILWSREYAAATETDDYVPLQRSLAEQMAAGLVRALDERT